MKERFLFFKIRNWADTDSFAQLYDLYVQKIYRFIYFKVGSVEEAQDLTSQTFLKVWQRLISPEASAIRNINAFIYQVARNSVIDYFRQKGLEKDWLENIDTTEEPVAPESTIDIVQSSMDKEVLMTAIKKMRPVFQEVILMRYVDDLPLDEIAAIINKSNGATRVLIHRALQELRRIINDSA